MDTAAGREYQEGGKLQMNWEEGIVTGAEEAIQSSGDQVQDEIYSHQQTIEALQNENYKLKIQNTVSSSNSKTVIEKYKAKIQEFQGAVNQRDQMIGKLQTRLAECIQNQDDLQADVLQQTETSAREIETLKMQLKETTDSLLNKNWSSGISQHEHLQLKNKLIYIQQNRAQDQQMLEQLTRQLSQKNEEYGHLECQYKHVLQKSQEIKSNADKLGCELNENKDIIEKLKEENSGLKTRMQQLENRQDAELQELSSKWYKEREMMEDQCKRKEDDLLKLQNENKALENNLNAAEKMAEDKLKEVEEETQRIIQREQIAKEKSSYEIQNLMKQLQEITMELTHTKENHRVQLATTEEQFEKQLTAKKQQMSEIHHEELLKIKSSHNSELSQLTHQIDALEKTQKEDHASLIKNLNSLNNLNLSLKEQLEGEKVKLKNLERLVHELSTEKEQLKVVVEGSKGREKDLQLSLKQECANRNAFQQKIEELNRKYVEVENMAENFKREIVVLNENLKVEAEKRSSVENRLALELQNVNNLSEEKANLENKLETINCQMKVMSDELLKSKDSKENLNLQYQETLQRYMEIELELNKCEKLVEEYELTCERLQSKIEFWDTERESLVDELKHCIKVMKTEIPVIEIEVKSSLEQKDEIYHLRCENEQLIKRCDELAQYEQECQILQENLSQMYSALEEAENKNKNIDELREKYLALFEQCQSVEIKRKRIEEDCEEKCECLNEKLRSLDSKLAAASGLTGKFQEISDHNMSVEQKLHNVVLKLKEAEDNAGFLEGALMSATLEKDTLVSELKQARIAHDSMEREKNECETDRDRMLEEYKMMKAELASTLLALDREVQLSTHRRLTSDVGVSVSTSTSFETNAGHGGSFTNDNHHLEGHADKDVVKEFNISAKITLKPQENEEKLDTCCEDKIYNLEKENKELLNEIEKLKSKVHDQHFGVKSLENEKSKLKRRLGELETEKVKIREKLEEYQKEISKKMDLQKQLDELKLTVHLTEDHLKKQEDEMNLLKKSLEAIVLIDKPDCTEKLKEIVNNIEISAVKDKSMNSFNCSNYWKTFVSCQSEELQCMCEELNKYLSEYSDLLQYSDKLHEEKLQHELENICLKVEVEKLKHLKSAVGGSPSKEFEPAFCEAKPNIEDESEFLRVQRELLKYKHENEKLHLQMKNHKTLLRLEKLHIQSSRINSEKETDISLDTREMVMAFVGMELEKLVEDWECQMKTDSTLVDFISAQTLKVCEIIRKLPDSLGESSDGETYVEAAMKLIRQAVIKNVGGQYMGIVKSLLAKLDKDITKSLQVTLPAVLLDLLKNISLSEDNIDIHHDGIHDEEVKSITDKVEHLINARNTLVEAANEFVEQLEAAVSLRTTCIKHELDDLIKLTTLKVVAKENEDGSKASTPDDTSLQGDVKQQFVQEFMEVTTNIYQEALSEKLQILKNQMMMVHKILEDNKAKLHNICQEHLEDLRSVTTLSDALKYSEDLVSSLEKTLAEEVSWVEQQYKELLEQYSYEQNLHMESQSLTLQELKNRLVGLFKNTDVEAELKELKTHHKCELSKLREQHAMEVHRLEHQLAARDQETLLEDANGKLHKIIEPATDVNSVLFQRHLQSLYSDRDWYKKTVGLLSHVTLQLLHYYSVAESYTNKSQDHKMNEDHGSIEQPELSSGKIVDLSFLSDCMPDDNYASQLHMLTEDSVLSTGLLGKTVFAYHSEDTEVASNSESVLDSTAMSEGMLEDMDKDEQVRNILTKSYPQLMSILKGRWDRVVVENLEKEVQELTISLQASAGMLKIFMHSLSSDNQEFSSHTVKDEIESDSVKETVNDLSQHHISDTTSKDEDNTMGNAPEDDKVQTKPEEKSESGGYGTLAAVFSAKKKLMHLLKSTEKMPHLLEDTAGVPDQSSLSQVFTALSPQDLNDLSESLSLLLSQDESFMNLTTLKHQELKDIDKLKDVLRQLCQNAQATEHLQVKLHHLEGLLRGLQDEKKALKDENNRLNHYSKNLAMELQVAKDQIEELELGQQGQGGGTATTQYAARMESSKDIRERVRATLSAKNKSLMDHNELVARVGDLEGILEALVRENDATVEALKSEVSDLTQQLDVADRQLRSSRQFLDEHASERDQEMEDLMRTKDKLASQLREKDVLLTQHSNLEKEVENLERQLREKSQELQDALASREEIQVEHKAAVDKIWDLREIIQSLEAQVDSKCVEEGDLNAQIENLKTSLSQARQQSLDLATQLEEHQCARSEQGNGHSREQLLTQGSRVESEEEEEEEVDAQLANASLFMELRDEYGQGTHNVSNQTLLQTIEERVERTTRELEALQLSVSSASHSAEDLSLQDVPPLQEIEADHASLLPASVEFRLEDKLLTLERTMEAAVKRTRDLEMTLKNLRVDYEEVTAERDMLQELSKEQLIQISGLEARLDEIRRSDHPMTSELKQRINAVQEDLEKKRSELAKKGREIEELKHNLSSTRGRLMSREEELERIQSMTQPHSLPQTTSDQLLTKQKQLEDEIASKNNLIDNLKKELVSASQPDIIPSTLAQSLIEDKNAEIKELIEQLMTIKSRVSEVITHIANNGNLVECQNLLQNILRGRNEFCSQLSDTETPEVLRKSSMVHHPDSATIEMNSIKEGHSAVNSSTGKSEEGVSITHPSSVDLTFMSVQPEAPIELSKVSSHDSSITKGSHVSEDNKIGESCLSSLAAAATTAVTAAATTTTTTAVTATGKEDKEMNGEENAVLHTSPVDEEITITKEEYENLCSASDEVTVLRAQIDLLQKEITNLNNYQARLEEDFKTAQDLLADREEEINQLSEEIEDSVPLPLPSETIQMQDRCLRLEEQVVALQETLCETRAISREYEEEIEKLNLRAKEFNEEVKELQGSIKLLREEVKQKDEVLNEKEIVLQEIKHQMKTDADQHKQKQIELCNGVKVLREQLEQVKQQHREQLTALQRKTVEVAELSTQVDLVHSEMHERLSHSNREITQLEQQYQKEISDLKEEQILREKQLCSDYEERMAAQVSDLSVKLGKDKEEAVARQQRFYESALREANLEKEQIQKELQEHLQIADLCNRSQQTSHLCDSLDALNAGVKQELDKSGQLDNTLVSYVKHGHARGELELSTRASSAVSDLSEEDEPCVVANKIQRLMNKVHREGIEMLTLIELMFLQKHQTHLDSSQKSLISKSGLIASGSAEGSIADSEERSHQYGLRTGVAPGERTQLLRHMAALEEELSKSEKEMKAKVGLVEFQLEQEKMSGAEWKLSFESEKKRTQELMEQLRQLKLGSVDRISELTLLRSQLYILQLQYQKTREENINLSESLESSKKEVETLTEALQAERNNFSRVSKVLNQQRRMAAATRAQQENVIKGLHNTLEKERERIMGLYTQMAEAANQHPGERPDRTCTTSRLMELEKAPTKDGSTVGRSAVEDLKMQLVIQQERFTEIQRLYERERLKVVTQNEQAHAERARARVDLMEEQGKYAELTKTVRNLEMEKDSLMRQISHDRERLQYQESRIRELEGEKRKLEGDLRAQADAHQAASHRAREEDAELHISYTRTLNKLGETEAELCTLHQKLRIMTKDLELAREKEQQLQKDLATEKMAINRLGLSALARINNLDDYFELQLEENLELCKSVLRLTDDRQFTRKKIVELENTVADLTRQLNKSNASTNKSPDIEKVLKMERSVWERERASLQNIISQKETEVTRLQTEAGSRTPQNIGNAQLNDERMQYICGKYIRSEHWRKALIWQKRYLLVVIKGFRENEENALSRLHTMASRVNGTVQAEAAEVMSNFRVQPTHRFRVGVLAVIAINRMKNMVQRYLRKRQFGPQIFFSLPHPAFTITSTPEASESSRRGSYDQGIAGRSFINTFTGQTPPTKGPSSISNQLWSAPSSSRRNLFHEEDSPRLNEYIERLDNIHSALGLNPKNI